MSTSAHSVGPPTYQQALSTSKEQLQQDNILLAYNIPVISVPVVQATVIKFGDQPITMNCPYCGYTITTVIEQENGAMVFIICILLAVFGLFCGCCLIPFCTSDLKDKIHFCPKCQKTLGRKTLL